MDMGVAMKPRLKKLNSDLVVMATATPFLRLSTGWFINLDHVVMITSPAGEGEHRGIIVYLGGNDWKLNHTVTGSDVKLVLREVGKRAIASV